MRRPRAGVAVALVLLLLGGCGGAGSDGLTGSSSPASASGTVASQSRSPASSSASAAPSRPASPTRTATPTATATATRTPSPTATATVPAVPAGLAGTVRTVLPTSRRVVALTFDGGAAATGAASVLATLADRGITATFLVTGDFASRYPGTVRAMAAAGHVVGNHSLSHPDFTTLTAAQRVEQLSRTEALVAPLTGRSTRPYFRFPYGAWDAASLRTVNGQGYAAFGWTVDTLGWKGTSGGQSVATVVDRVVDAARPGEIVLMHVGANPDDGSTLDADALPLVIDQLEALGYGFVTLGAALE